MDSKKNVKEKVTLKADERSVVGKKVNSLRKKGILPGNVYGNNYTSKTVSMSTLDFMAAYKLVKQTGVLYVKVGDESIPTLISDMQIHPITEKILHVDFRKINMKEKIETEIPVVFVGESEAVKTLNGVLITQLEHVMVEALPANLPQQIEVDITHLTEIGSSITIADLPKSDDYIFTDEPEKVIVSITAHKEESIEPDIESAAPEITTAVEGEGEAGEGETAEAPKTDGASEAKSE